ncbi:MAG: carboxypeptidase-like regulatory domain-containing protein [Usitatibacter sp.]
MTVHFYIDGTYATGVFGGAVAANVQRSDVASVCNGTTAHGYGWNVPAQFLTPGDHSIYAYAIDNGGVGPNPLLGNSPLSFVVAAQATYSISGTTGAPGAVVNAGSVSSTADASGAYVVSGLSAGTYTVGVTKSGCSFSPASQNVTVGPDATGRNFTAACATAAPIGYLDSVGASGGATVASGWTCDPDNWGMALTLHFYLDGSYATGTFVGAALANANRPDLAAACGGTTMHGFTFVIPSQYLSAGTHALFAYALDNGGVGPNPLLANSPWSFTVAPPSNYSISGRTGTPGAVVTAGGVSSSADADGHYIISGLPTGTYTVTPMQPGSNCSIVPATLSVSIGPNATNADFETQCEKSWSPRITETAVAYRDCVQGYVPPLTGPFWTISNSNEIPLAPNNPTAGVGCLSSAQLPGFITYSFSGPQHAPHTVTLALDKITSDIALPLTGTNQTVNFSTTFSTAFIDENLDATGANPTLDQDLRIDLRVKLAAHAVGNVSQPIPALDFPYAGFPNVNGMSRVTIGIPATWDGKTFFLEIVLWRDAAFDSCTNSTTSWWSAMIHTWPQGQTSWYCDTTGLYDRRGSFGSVELVYYYAPALYGNVPAQYLPGVTQPIPQLSIGGTNSYSLPISKLFQWYFQSGGADIAPPSGGWSNARVGGVYMGIEMWGRASTRIELDNYRLYSVRK